MADSILEEADMSQQTRQTAEKTATTTPIPIQLVTIREGA